MPVTYAGGATVGAVNQVAFTTAGPAYAGGVGAGTAVVETAGYVAFVAYDAAAGATKVFRVSGATGEGIEDLLDAVLGYLPDRTATETQEAEVEDEGEAPDWSPI